MPIFLLSLGSKMKIYLAASAPGNESQREREEFKRLLSYYMIKEKMMECHKIFYRLVKEKHENFLRGRRAL